MLRTKKKILKPMKLLNQLKKRRKKQLKMGQKVKRRKKRMKNQNKKVSLKDCFACQEVKVLSLIMLKINFMRRMIRSKRKFRKNSEVCLLSKKQVQK